jgi:aspartyl-tRNA(Asn)/glutamyl-tRNA(Gln) amidotransferase subunit B
MNWDCVIGLETHAQLKTKSKLFSAAATQYGAEPNSQVSFVDAGLPGVLPVLNQEAMSMAIRFGLAIQGSLQDGTFFERKNYFYPDLPKGYQISQYQRPIIRDGKIDIMLQNTSKSIPIERAHLEEDAGKSQHAEAYSLIDLNRAGNPLLEIVTAPCFTSAKEVIIYLKTLQELVRFLDICDGNMQEGSFRCDVNLSLKPKGTQILGTKVEIKNLNSFRYIEEAIAYEIERQTDILAKNGTINQETRLYSPNKRITVAMRSKENEQDYRYFPDPDLLPISLSPEMIQKIQHNLPELPQAIRCRLATRDQLAQEDIDFVMQSKLMLNHYENIKQHTHTAGHIIINWIKQFQTCDNALLLANILQRMTDQKLSTHQAKTLLNSLLEQPGDLEERVNALGFHEPMDTQTLASVCADLISTHPQQVADFKAGKTKMLGFFMGKVMKQAQGKADPEKVQAILLSLL